MKSVTYIARVDSRAGGRGREQFDLKRRAFTLAEILIVVGIIAVLIGFLLVVTRKGGEAARKVACASNLRQLAAAFTSYAQDNEGRYPGAAEIFQTLREDWIYWDDPRGTFRALNRSPIAKYLGKGDVAAILRCPSDDVGVRPKQTGAIPYAYSYSFNYLFSSTRPKNLGPLLRLSSVVDPSRKMMVLDEDIASIDDGAWKPYVFNGSNETFLAIRHDKKREGWEKQTGVSPLERIDRNDRGNVAFADGHVDFVPRADTWQAMYYDPRSTAGRDPLH